MVAVLETEICLPSIVRLTMESLIPFAGLYDYSIAMNGQAS